MKDRTAISTIRGYFYQFDYSILSILQLKRDIDSITIEGIEDIDVSELNSNTAIQCKYYENTEYNHSEIAQPIRFMLKDHEKRKENGKPTINYKLYGYYKSGQQKLPSSISTGFLKEHFLTYTHSKKKIFYYEDLKITDEEIQDFITHLQIEIYAEEFSNQLQNIFKILKEHFMCSEFEAEHYYYNNALKLIKNLATKRDIKDRKISKKEFMKEIDEKEVLFNQWFYFFKGTKEVFKQLRSNRKRIDGFF